VIAIIACLSAVYIAIDYYGISYRYGAPIARDLIIGLILLFLLMEAARRVIGPALSVIAGCFCFYAFFGPYMPDVIAFKGVSLGRFMGQITMSTEGIYGIPLDVSATIVFLFVLFGAMLEKAGAGQYFIQIALSLLGGFKGGPAKAAVMGSGLTGLVSGSSIANIVTTGTFTIPLMKKVGYPAKKAAAVEVAASTDGQLAPPIMGAAAFIIAEYVNVPYVEVIKAAAIPAFASYAALFYITHIEASKLGLRGLSRSELPKFFKTLLGGAHFLIPLSMLLYELIVVRHSPELSAFNAIWVMAIIMLFQNPVKAYMKKEPLGAAFKLSIVQIFSALATGARNMTVWTLHNAVRYCFVASEGPVVLFEFHSAPHLPAGLETIDEIRTAIYWFYFGAGQNGPERVKLWVAELADLDVLARREDRDHARAFAEHVPHQEVAAVRFARRR